MDKTIIITVVLIVLAGFIFWGFQTGFFAGTSNAVVATPLPAGIVLFYGAECPHCKVVEDFITQNNINAKVKITQLEVWHNASNAKLLVNVATKICKITGNSVGVPFLYDGNGKCYIGETDVPNFLKAQAGIK